MCHDPNVKFIGKTVLIVGRNQLKGSKGVIKSTSADGEVFVQLHIFNRPQLEKLKLESLQLQYANVFPGVLSC